MADAAEAAVWTGNQKEVTELAFDEGHDADIASNAGFVDEHTRQRKARSDSSLSGSHLDRDIEKADVDADRQPSDHSSTRNDVDPQEKDEAEVVEAPVNPNIVDWDGPNDPANPMNWGRKKVVMCTFILSLLTLLSPLASSMFAPGVPEVMAEFKSDSTTLAEFVVSVYLLGFAIGPLVISPFSELYGRLPVYIITTVLFIIFTVGCALSTNLNMLIAFRFLAGCVGVAPVTIGGGTIADMFRQEKRGAAMAVWAMGPLLGPVIGPVAGGYLSGSLGWRWVFWILAIAEGAVGIFIPIVTRESYAPVLLARKAKKLRKETGNMELRSKLDNGLSPKELFRRAIVRPTKMLFCSPIVFSMSLYMAVVYGILYLLFTTFTFVFIGSYGFTDSNVGLVYIGTGIGMLLGLAVLGATSDPLMKRLTAKHGGGMKPEYRLPPLIVGGCFLPVGLFLYGWTAEKKVQWAVPLLGTLIVGVGLLTSFMCVQTYIVDAFTIHAASAVAAITVLRSVFGAILPLAGLPMYDALGYGWGNSLLAFLTLAMIPIPVLFFKYGERIRTTKRFKVVF